MPKRTETVNLLSSQSLAKNASIESALIYMGKMGADSKFELDLSVTNAGKIRAVQLVGNNPDDTFYTPTSADVLASGHLGGASATASRERYQLGLVGTEWMRIKFYEQNASNVVFDANLIMSN